jgi:hypothetical protein
MDQDWLHAHLYAISPDSDPLAYPLEPYLCIYTPDGTRFLYSPHLATNGPHPITPEDIELARTQGFDLFPQNIISLWEQRDSAILSIARSEGIIPNDDGPLADAEAIIRMATPSGRIANALWASTNWPGSTAYFHQTPHGTFDSTTIILRTKNPYQARSLLIMLGANRDDIADITGIEN